MSRSAAAAGCSSQGSEVVTVQRWTLSEAGSVSVEGFKRRSRGRRYRRSVAQRLKEESLEEEAGMAQARASRLLAGATKVVMGGDGCVEGI